MEYAPLPNRLKIVRILTLLRSNSPSEPKSRSKSAETHSFSASDHGKRISTKRHSQKQNSKGQTMTTVATNITATSASTGFSLIEAIKFFKLAVAIKKQRKQLKKMSAAQLHDIGVSREDAMTESQKSFWDVPVYWR